MKRFVLTEEGRKYKDLGLPEKRLLDVLKSPMAMEEARKKLDDFSIALTWAKKKNWVKVENGMLMLLNKPKEFPEQKALEEMDKGNEIKDELLGILLKRSLIKKTDDMYSIAENQLGKTLASLTPELIKTGMWKNAELKPYNVEVPGKKLYGGKLQPYNNFLSQVREKLVELGFREMPGHLVETEFWNFDALYQPQNHPSRDWTQTYSLKNPITGSLPDQKTVSNVKSAHENGWKTGSTGWGYSWDPKKASRLMPRAHTTASSARQLASGVEVPGKYFAISRCFRPDVIDATHGVEFNQAEGIVIDPSLDFRSLLGILKMFAAEMAGAEDVKFLPDYYPFVEPGVQLSAKHPQLGWIELGGAGIFREELTKPLGSEHPVIAWGLGIDRLAMFRLGIKDIRYLFSSDLDWLRRQPV